MASIFDEVLYYTTRFKTQVSFKNSSGQQETRDFFGSGVWIASPRGGKNLFFITNRHLVDFNFDKAGWERIGAEAISNVDIELRKFKDKTPLSETQFFDLVSVQNKIFYPLDGSDMAVIAISTSLTNFREAVAKGFKPLCLSLDSYLAQNDYFENELKAIDSVSFIGFPASDYDSINNLPIARNANIASDPNKRFKNEWVEGDIVLVSGLSFGGSSGSPVYSLPVGNPAIGVGRVLEPKFIGIISGHLVDKNKQHKGLSYFVKASKIVEVLNNHNLLSP